jgi:hypothetical protein
MIKHRQFLFIHSESLVWSERFYKHWFSIYGVSYLQ